MSKQKMSADQLSACRKRLEQLWKSRIVDEGLLHRAWHTVMRWLHYSRTYAKVLDRTLKKH